MSVDCPACPEPETLEACLLCGGSGTVGVDAAIEWVVAAETIAPPSGATVSKAEVDRLAETVDLVLRGLAAQPSSRDVAALTDAALQCERLVRGWQLAPPMWDECEALARRLLQLHIALRNIALTGKP